MSTSREKKQKNILYFCFVILIITAAVAVAVTGGFKRSVKNATPAETETAESETAASVTGAVPGGEKSGKETGKTDAGIIPARPESKEESTEPVALIPEPISFVAPAAGAVCSAFSDSVPVFSETMNDYRTHEGVDVSSSVGEPVFACADGVIDEVWADPMMGQSVKITHADGYESVYRNLSADFPDGIAKGAEVRAGQTIGAVGETALIECEDEPHLHFELRLAGTPVNPEEYIVFAAAENDYEG